MTLQLLKGKRLPVSIQPLGQHRLLSRIELAFAKRLSAAIIKRTEDVAAQRDLEHQRMNQKSINGVAVNDYAIDTGGDETEPRRRRGQRQQQQQADGGASSDEVMNLLS